MNSRGVLFTIMMLMIILSMLSLINVVEKGKRSNEEEKELIVLEEIDNSYNNIQRNVIVLSKEGKNKEIMERVLPFKYNIDANAVEIMQELPLKEAILRNFFNVVNSFEVFLNDKNYGGKFGNLNIDANAMKNAQWGGSANSLNFLVNPFCVRISDQNDYLEFVKSTGDKCTGAFSTANIRRYDVNVAVLQTSEDFNAVLCNGGACPLQAFSQTSTQPYFRIEIIDSNCTKCMLPQKIISKHFNAETEDFNIFIYCKDATCNSKPITILVGEGLGMMNSGNQVKIKALYTFNGGINEVIYSDFNYLVENKAFKVKKTNY